VPGLCASGTLALTRSAGEIACGTAPRLGVLVAAKSAPRRGECPYMRIALGLGWRLEIYTGLVIHDAPGRRVSPLSKAR